MDVMDEKVFENNLDDDNDDDEVKLTYEVLKPFYCSISKMI
jgi:hypothetical protein